MLNAGREPINLSLNFTDSAGRLIKQSFETVEGERDLSRLTPGTVDDVAGRFQIPRRLKHPVAEATGAGKSSPPFEVFDNRPAEPMSFVRLRRLGLKPLGHKRPPRAQ